MHLIKVVRSIGAWGVGEETYINSTLIDHAYHRLALLPGLPTVQFLITRCRFLHSASDQKLNGVNAWE